MDVVKKLLKVVELFTVTMIEIEHTLFFKAGEVREELRAILVI